MIWLETKLFVREPVNAFFGIAFPALLLVVLGSAIPGFQDPVAELGGRRAIEGYLPITLTMAIATVAMVTLLGVLSGYREKGVLRRLSATPVSPRVLLGAQVVVNVGALLVSCLLAWLAAAIVFDVGPPGNIAGFVLAFTLGSSAMCALALAVAGLTPNARASSSVGSLIYFPMMFFAGVWTPGPLMPGAVQRIADFTPLGAASAALQDAWAGDWPQWGHLAVMAAFTVGLGAVAARYLRWE
ncbi:ABC transporter permease [Actinoplanes sp. GCM10030250]|uniref:ABC transporter permease n=1 Tax=Actinoplanes sp. GCM10030250 TaxID=3273376 RepID=UPI003610AE44